MNTNENQLKRDDSKLFDRIVAILEDARSHVSRTVNSAMVIAYWLIGREIVEEEQKGKKRAEYGKLLIDEISIRLTKRYGKGFSTTNLRYFRQFYLTYKGRVPEIRHPSGGEFAVSQKSRPKGGESTQKRHPAGGESEHGFHPNLSWSQYRALMRVENEEARLFYECEVVRKHWNKQQQGNPCFRRQPHHRTDSLHRQERCHGRIRTRRRQGTHFRKPLQT